MSVDFCVGPWALERNGAGAAKNDKRMQQLSKDFAVGDL